MTLPPHRPWLARRGDAHRNLVFNLSHRALAKAKLRPPRTSSRRNLSSLYPEKALIDVLYLSQTKRRLFVRLPDWSTEEFQLAKSGGAFVVWLGGEVWIKRSQSWNSELADKCKSGALSRDLNRAVRCTINSLWRLTSLRQHNQLIGQ